MKTQLPTDLFDTPDPAELRRLAAAEDTLRAALSTTRIPDTFNDALRARLLATAPAQSESAARKRPLFPARLLALAASLLLGIFLGTQFLSTRSITGTSVAWADVVHAMNAVDHFHILCYTEDPRATNADRRFTRIDLYHQAPNLWRAQGFNTIAFNTPAGTTTISPDQNTPPDNHLNLIPSQFVQSTKDHGLLDGILAMIFQNNPPPGQPVKSDAVSAGQGIEVFDYANAPTSQWARIWVLKDSRLPLRIHLYYPESDSFMSVEFDYSDPQPPEFFDPDFFRKQLAEKHITTTRQAFGIGMHPLVGAAPKPRNSTEINEALGGFHAPTLRRALVRPDGDIALITAIPNNRRPNGGEVYDQRFDDLSDSWGNRYLPIGRTSGISPDGDERWYFTAIAPFKTATTPRRLTLSYTLMDYERGQVGPTEHVLATSTIDLDSATPAQNDDWDDHYLNLAKPAAVRNFLRSTATLADQIAAIDAALAKDPDDTGAILWKVDLLRAHQREDAAWLLFAPYLQTHFPTTFSELLDNNLYTHIAQYMVYLAHNSRFAEFDALAAALEPFRQSALSTPMTPNRKTAADILFGPRYHSLLAGALELRNWKQLLRDHPPTVTSILATTDGAVIVQLRVPLQPEAWQEYGHSSGGNWDIAYGWFWDPRPTEWQRWQTLGQLDDMQTGDVWLALRPLPGEHPTTLTLTTDTKLLRDNTSDFYLPHPENTVPFPRSVTLQHPAPTVPNITAWWTANAANRRAFWLGATPSATRETSPIDTWSTDANTARTAARFDDAIALYKKILAAPADQFPAWTTNPVNGPDFLDETRRNYRIDLIKTLVAAHQLDAARTELATFRATLAPKPNLTSPTDTLARKQFRIADLALVRTLIADNHLPEARAELDTLAKDRPDLAALPDRAILLQRGPSQQGTTLRRLHQDAWFEFDTTWWQLQDAQQHSKE